MRILLILLTLSAVACGSSKSATIPLSYVCTTEKIEQLYRYCNQFYCIPLYKKQSLGCISNQGESCRVEARLDNGQVTSNSCSDLEAVQAAISPLLEME